MEETHIHPTMTVATFKWHLHRGACLILTATPEEGRAITLFLTDKEADRERPNALPRPIQFGDGQADTCAQWGFVPALNYNTTLSYNNYNSIINLITTVKNSTQECVTRETDVVYRGRRTSQRDFLEAATSDLGPEG